MPPTVIHRSVLTCRHVLQLGSPVKRVTRGSRDGVWRFLCSDHRHRGEALWLVSRRVLNDRDRTLATLDTMPCGATAERRRCGASWRIRRPGSREARHA